MRILVYKQTHINDPTEYGCWGRTGCMGCVRGFHYDAVIGVGGIGRRPKQEGIDAKVTWLGIDPTILQHKGFRGPIVTFDRFQRLEDQGQKVSVVAPALYRRMFEQKARFVVLHAGQEYEEAKALLSKLTTRHVPLNQRLKRTCMPSPRRRRCCPELC